MSVGRQDRLGLVRFLFFFQAEDGIRDLTVTGVQTCALPICLLAARRSGAAHAASRPSAAASPPITTGCAYTALATSAPVAPAARNSASTGKIGRASCRERV